MLNYYSSRFRLSIPNLRHRFDKSQTLTTSPLGQSPIEYEMSLGLMSTQILVETGLVSEEMVCRALIPQIRGRYNDVHTQDENALTYLRQASVPGINTIYTIIPALNKYKNTCKNVQ